MQIFSSQSPRTKHQLARQFGCVETSLLNCLSHIRGFDVDMILYKEGIFHLVTEISWMHSGAYYNHKPTNIELLINHELLCALIWTY